MKVLEKVKNNAYKIELPSDYGVSVTFNLSDLSPFYEVDGSIPSLRSNSSQQEEDDGVASSSLLTKDHKLIHLVGEDIHEALFNPAVLSSCESIISLVS